jgi:hypothetical protein
MVKGVLICYFRHYSTHYVLCVFLGLGWQPLKVAFNVL